MSPASTPTYPNIPPIDPARIPELIKGSRRWFPWRAGPIKETEKFDKIPTHPGTGRNIDPLAPANWFSFEEALSAYRKGVGNGIGIALSEAHPIVLAGVPYYLTAVDRDNCADHMDECEAVWRQLGKTYIEASPSGKGLRLLGLSRTLVHSGNAGEGRELYADKHFVTITGNGGRGAICDFTTGIVALERQWFGDRTAPKPPKRGLLGQPAQPEHPVFVEPVLSMLDAVSSDTDYDTWRDIIYSLASTGWACARQLAHIWSAKATHRYDSAYLDKLFDSFDPARGITLGTLGFHARKNGWTSKPSSLLQVQPLPPPPPPPHLPPTSLLMTAAQLRQIPAPPYVVRNVSTAA